MVNEGQYIEPNVINLILIQALAYDETTDRAFNLIGQYPITPSTLGPVSLPVRAALSVFHRLKRPTNQFRGRSQTVRGILVELHDYCEQVPSWQRGLSERIWWQFEQIRQRASCRVQGRSVETIYLEIVVATPKRLSGWLIVDVRAHAPHD